MKLNQARKLVIASAILCFASSLGSTATAVTRVWNKTAGGTLSFTDVANWDDGSTSFPNGVDDIASMDTLDLAGTQTVTLNQSITLGELHLGDTGGGSGLSFPQNLSNSGGSGALVFQKSSGNAQLTFGNPSVNLRTNLNINVPVRFNSDTEVSLALQSSGSRNLYFITGALTGSGNMIINSANRGTVAFFTDTYNLSSYTGTIKYTSNGTSGNFLQLAGNTVAGGARNLQGTTLEMAVTTAGGNVSIFDAQDGAILELGALRGDGLIVPFTNKASAAGAAFTDTLKTGYLPGTNNYSGVISGTARFPFDADPVTINYEKVGAISTQIFSGANTYPGTTTVSGGTLLVNGTHTGGSQYTVNGVSSADYNGNGVVDSADYIVWRKDPNVHGGDPAGYTAWRQEFGNGAGTLGGTGTISASVVVNPGGTLAPGASVGTLSVGGADIDGILRVEYDGNVDTIDKLAVSGDLDISSAKVDFDNLAVASLNGGPHIIATYGTLTGAAFASVVDLPGGYTIDYNYLSANQIALVPGAGGGVALESAAGVPEPTGLLLASVAVMGFGAVTRRRS